MDGASHVLSIPLLAEGGYKRWKHVDGVAVENPLSRGGHTQVAAFGAFFSKPVAGVVVVSFLDIEPHELSRSSFSAGGWKCIFMHLELEWRTPVYKLEFC